MKEQSIVSATRWTKDELIPHIAKREAIGVSNGEFIRDVFTAIRVIHAQATHLARASSALVSYGEKLNTDLKNKGY